MTPKFIFREIIELPYSVLLILSGFYLAIRKMRQIKKGESSLGSFVSEVQEEINNLLIFYRKNNYHIHVSIFGWFVIIFFIVKHCFL